MTTSKTPATDKLRSQCRMKATILNALVDTAVEKMPDLAKEQLNLVLASSAELLLLAESQAEQQQERLARLKVKNGNYRLGMKQLQKAHEALLHRYNTLKASTELKREAETQQNVRIPEPGYTDYFKPYGVAQASPVERHFDSRAQSPEKVSTRL